MTESSPSPSEVEAKARQRKVLVIRFFRTGKKNQPFFKIVVTDKKNPPRGGRFVDEIGFWNPIKKEKLINVEKAKYWLSVGAKPSDSVYNLFISEKVLEGKKIPAHKKKKKKKGEEGKGSGSAPSEAPSEKKGEKASSEGGNQEESKKEEQKEPKEEEKKEKEKK